MIYFIKCDWQKVPKERTIGIMGVKGVIFHFFMFCYFSCVFVVYNLWVLVCIFHAMLAPCSWIGNAAWFLKFSFIMKIRMRQRGWQCTWWWKRINTWRWRKLNILGFQTFLWFYVFSLSSEIQIDQAISLAN
jgi:hypothetical protein